MKELLITDGLWIRYLAPQKFKALLLGLFLIADIILQLVNPQLIRQFIDIASSKPGNQTSSLVVLAVLYIGIALAVQVLAILTNLFSQQIAWSSTNLLREDLARHCLKLDMSFHDERSSGEMIQRIDGDVTALSNFFSKFVVNIAGNILLMIGVIVVLWLEDWRIGLASAFFATLALLILSRIRGIALPYTIAYSEAVARLFGFIEERLAGLDDIRSNGAGSFLMRRFFEASRTLYQRGQKSALRVFAIYTVTNTVFALGYGLALLLGVYLFLGHQISLGTVYLFFQYIVLLRKPLDNLTAELRDFQTAGASIARVQELFGIENAIKDGPGPYLPAGPLAVEFEAVSFGYKAGSKVISDLSFQLQPGRTVGLLGRTGSGKTTIARLLFRLYDIQEGMINLGGRPLKDLSLAELRQRVGIITQDVELFQATIHDNLTLFDQTVPEQRILQTIEKLQLKSWLEAQPQGLDTVIQAGENLSAGEAQLLAFVRVFLKDPDLLILDEASSRLDPATQQLVERALDTLVADRTCIIIAHRLETVERVDDIIIIEKGQLQEQGSRNDLIKDPNSRFSALLKTGLEEVLV
jgi:ABC-type multidrug transport system fused ATPase/permease subunit